MVTRMPSASLQGGAATTAWSPTRRRVERDVDAAHRLGNILLCV